MYATNPPSLCGFLSYIFINSDTTQLEWILSILSTYCGTTNNKTNKSSGSDYKGLDAAFVVVRLVMKEKQNRKIEK